MKKKKKPPIIVIPPTLGRYFETGVDRTDWLAISPPPSELESINIDNQGRLYDIRLAFTDFTIKPPATLEKPVGCRGVRHLRFGDLKIIGQKNKQGIWIGGARPKFADGSYGELIRSEDVSVRDCGIINTEFGIDLTECTDFDIAYNDISNFTRDGISIACTGGYVGYNDIYNFSAEAGIGIHAGNKETIIEWNKVHDCYLSQEELAKPEAERTHPDLIQCFGNDGNIENLIIRYNEFYNADQIGQICFRPNWGRNITFAYNKIWNDLPLDKPLKLWFSDIDGLNLIDNDFGVQIMLDNCKNVIARGNTYKYPPILENAVEFIERDF